MPRRHPSLPSPQSSRSSSRSPPFRVSPSSCKRTENRKHAGTGTSARATSTRVSRERHYATGSRRWGGGTFEDERRGRTVGGGTGQLRPRAVDQSGRRRAPHDAGCEVKNESGGQMCGTPRVWVTCVCFPNESFGGGVMGEHEYNSPINFKIRKFLTYTIVLELLSLVGLHRYW